MDFKENQMQLPAQMPTGLENLGNSYYTNAIIQCICNTSGLRSFLLDELQTGINQDGQPSDREVSQKLAKAAEFTWSGRHRSVALHDLRHAIGHQSPSFRGKTQQDAHEFFLCLQLKPVARRVQRSSS